MVLRWLFGFMLTTGICQAADSGTAPSISARFDQANKFYEQGKYAEAISAYRLLLDQQQVSAAVYFNLGNAYFKSNQAGQAIACYRLAQRLAPRDPDIGANLRFAREGVNSSPGLPRWERWVNRLTVNEMTFASMAAVWLWFLLLAAAQWRREWARNWRSYLMMSGLAAGLAVAGLVIVLQKRLGSAPAIVIAPEASVRYGPFEEAQRFYTLRDGAELLVLDRKDNWLQVIDASRRTGWLQTNDVLVLPAG